MTDQPLGQFDAKRIGGVRRDLTWICDRWGDVHETRLKGTARPWQASTMSAETRAELDARARIERIERSGIAPGERQAPVHIDVLDVLSDVLMRADMLHEHMAQVLGIDRLPHAMSAFDDATPYLMFIHVHLADFADDDPDGLAAASETTRYLKDEMAKVLCEVYDGQRLDAICCFCDGRAPHHPTGGGKTLVVHMMPMPTADNPGNQEPAIVCDGGACDPPQSDCGKRWFGLPAWPMAEWEWLAKRLDHTA